MLPALASSVQISELSRPFFRRPGLTGGIDRAHQADSNIIGAFNDSVARAPECIERWLQRMVASACELLKVLVYCFPRCTASLMSSTLRIEKDSSRVAVLWDATIGTVQFRGTETAARPSGVTQTSGWPL